MNTYYASYGLCQICLRHNIDYIHCSGNFKFQKGVIYSYDEVIGIMQSDGKIALKDRPYGTIPNKHYNILIKHNTYMEGRKKRENMRYS